MSFDYDTRTHILSWITWLAIYVILLILFIIGLRCRTIYGVVDVENILEWVCL